MMICDDNRISRDDWEFMGLLDNHWSLLSPLSVIASSTVWWVEYETAHSGPTNSFILYMHAAGDAARSWCVRQISGPLTLDKMQDTVARLMLYDATNEGLRPHNWA